MTKDFLLFDRKLVKARRARTARAFASFDFLHKEVAERLADRLDDVKRSFPLALAMGSRGPVPGKQLQGHGGIEKLLLSDLAFESLSDDEAGSPGVVLDEEFLPLAPASLDLVIGCLALHWVNDLPGALLQIRRSLKPDGLFLAALFGAETLKELRSALLDAELETESGAGARISPFVDLRDAAGLMQRAGFALPVADLDRIPVSYPDVFKLLADLRGMGEANALIERPAFGLSRRSLLRLAEIYQERHGRPDGKVTATFEIIFLTGWAPAENQPKALRPGSAAISLAEALGGSEEKLGEMARPARPKD